MRLVWLLALTGCVVPVNRSLPRGAFRESRIALERSTAATAIASPSAIDVGWGASEIKAAEGTSLAGYGSRAGEPHEGVHDPTFARAIALRAEDGQPVVFLATDILLIEGTLRAAIAERLAGVIAMDRIILTATHTHGGLGGYADNFAFRFVTGAPDDRAKSDILDAIDTAVRAAIASLAPGRVALGEVEAPGLSTNRIKKVGLPVDPVAGVLLVERKSDKQRAVLVTYGAHATVVSDLDRRVTADYPGAMARALESHGLAMAAFAAGAVGSMSPRAGWSEQPGAEWQGQALAGAVLAALPRLSRDLVDRAPLVALQATLVLPPRQWRVIAADWSMPAPFTEMFVPIRAPVTAVTLGRATWVSLPFELSGEIAARIRARARNSGHVLVLSSFGGEYAGYVTPPAAYDMPEADKADMADYETRLLGFYGPHMGDLAAAAAWRTMLAAESRTTGVTRAPQLVRMPPPATSPPPEPARPPEK